MPPTLPPFVCNPMNGTVEVHAYSGVDGCRMSLEDIIKAVHAITHHPDSYVSREVWQAERARWLTILAQAVRS